MFELLVKLLIQSVCVAIGKNFSDFLAVEFTCATSGKCPDKVALLQARVDARIPPVDPAPVTQLDALVQTGANKVADAVSGAVAAKVGDLAGKIKL